MKKRISESIGKDVKLVLQNNFIYAGKITNADDKYFEILDYKSDSYHVFEFSNVKDFEVRE